VTATLFSPQPIRPPPSEKEWLSLFFDEKEWLSLFFGCHYICTAFRKRVAVTIFDENGGCHIF
jgi:hypothetical protein